MLLEMMADYSHTALVCQELFDFWTKKVQNVQSAFPDMLSPWLRFSSFAYLFKQHMYYKTAC